MERAIDNAAEFGGQEAMNDRAQRDLCETDPLKIALSVKCALCTQPCMSRDVGSKLNNAGLRPTRQRVELARLLFGNGDRHVTADMLHEEAVLQRIPVSLATVYNTLQQFTNVGLLRRLATDSVKAWFDTNVTDHHHLFIEDDNCIVDVPPGYLSIDRLPPVPDGMEIARVEVVVRLKKREAV